MLTELQLDDDAPWKERFRVRFVWGTAIAAKAPSRGLRVRGHRHGSQLAAWDVQSGRSRYLTDEPGGKTFGYLAPDGRHVYYLRDDRGNEIGKYFRVPYDGGLAEDVSPDLPPFSPLSFGLSLDGRVVGFSTASHGDYTVYLLDLGPDGSLGQPRILTRSAAPTGGPFLSHDGDIVVVTTTERTGRLRWSLRAFDARTGAQIGELWEGPEGSVGATSFAPVAGDRRLLGATAGEEGGSPFIWDPVTSARFDLPVGELRGPVLPMAWSPSADRVLLDHSYQAFRQLYLFDLRDNSLTRLKHPTGSIRHAYFVSDDEIFAEWQDATHSSSLIALDARSGAVTRTVLAGGEAPPGRPWRSITFASSDGQPIQGWLGVPAGTGPYPTILHVHGGPEEVATETYNPASQTWMEHGFAYCTINYRGSRGFGPKFREQIWGNLGFWEVEDMVAARKWLIEQGISHPDQVLVTGASYGGYLTLQALGTKPDLWIGGMALIAVADWAMASEDTTENLKGIRAARFGGTPEEAPEQYARSSPITYADRVTAPVLIIQGRHDTRTPPRSVEVYAAKMAALGKPVELHWFDAGHGSHVSEERIRHMALMLDFAYRALGAR
jgi:acetyl esterase/lipase